MPKKRVRDQKDLFMNQEELFSSAAPDGSSKKKAVGVVAFDVWDGVLRTAVGNSSDKISYSVISDGLAPDQIQRLKSYQIFATQESLGKLDVIEQQGLKIKTLPRSLAVYWSFQRKVGDQPCHVISIEANCTRCALIVNGKLVEQREEAFELSLRGIWRNYVEGHGPFKRWLEAYKHKDANFEDQLFEGFLSALGTGKIAPVGPISIIPPIDLSSSLNAFRNLLKTLDQHQAAEVVILSNWAAAAHCNLAELMRPEYKTVLVAQPDKIFHQAVRGLIVYSLTASKPGKPPVLKLLHQALTFPQIAQGERAQSAFKIRNVGGGTLQSQIKSKYPWLKVLTDRVSCAEGKEQAVLVEIDTSELAAEQSYTGEIEIEWTSEDRIETKKLPVSVVTVKPKAAANEPPPLLTKTLHDLELIVNPQAGANEPPPPQEVLYAPPIEAKYVARKPAHVTANLTGIEPQVRTEENVAVEKPAPEQLIAVAEQPVTSLSLLGTVAVVAIVIAMIVFFFWIKRQPSGRDSVNLNRKNTNEAQKTINSPSQTQRLPGDVSANTAPAPISTPQALDPANNNIAQQTVPASTPDRIGNVNGVAMATPTPTNPASLPVGPSPQELAREHQRNAEQLRDQGQINEALAEVYKGLSLDPANQSLRDLRIRLESAKNTLDRQSQLAAQTPGAPRTSPTPQSAPSSAQVSNRKAELLSSPPQLYPPTGDSARKSATVWVEVTIDERGNVSSARPFRGPSQLYLVAVNAALQSRFRPALRNGQPVSDKQTLPIMFHPR